MNLSQTKRTMRRQASDNQYLHKDFHGVLSGGLTYLETTGGGDAVRAFIRRFVNEYHAPLKLSMRAKGLVALRAYIERIYKIEEANYTIQVTPGKLAIHLLANPAIEHIRLRGYPMTAAFHETDSFFYDVLCEDTPLKFTTELINAETGERQLTFTETKGTAP